MNDKKVLLEHIDQIHTTSLGENRIICNLGVKEDDVVLYLKEKIKKKNCIVYKKGKNYYCDVDSILITIHSHNYCIITAHKQN